MYILHHDVGAYRACPHTNTLLHGVHTTHSDTTMRVPVGALPADIPLHGVWNTSELANWQTGRHCSLWDIYFTTALNPGWVLIF